MATLKKSGFILAAAVFTLASVSVRAGELETLTVRLKHSKCKEAGVFSKEQEQIVKRFQSIGARAIPSLLPLLSDPSPVVRKVAAEILSGIDGLKEEHLDALMLSCCHDDVGWTAYGVARIGTPRAVDFLVEELVRRRDTWAAASWAVRSLRAKAVPRLLQVYQTNLGWDDRLERTMNDTFRDLGSAAESAVDPLRKIVTDEMASPARRIHAMRALGAIGTTAERAVPDLQALQKSTDPQLSEAATNAIVDMGTAAVAPILAERLVKAKDEFPRHLLFRDIAALHARGRDAGPTVAKFLSSDDWEIRVYAAHTLGFIGYQEANAELLRFLGNKEDWRLLYCAADSLGRLEVMDALPALTQLSKHHWYPPVRSIARTAITAIRSHSHREVDADSFNSDFFSYREAGRGYDSLLNNEDSRIRLPLVEIPNPIPQTILKNPRRFGITRGGLKVDDGYLVSRYRGPDAEIAFTDFEEISRRIVSPQGFVGALYRIGTDIFALAGQEDNAADSGIIYRLEKDAAGEWHAAQWRQLPAAPRFSRLLRDGRILVNTTRGITAVSPDGSMQLLTRKDVLKPPWRRPPSLIRR